MSCILQQRVEDQPEHAALVWRFTVWLHVLHKWRGAHKTPYGGLRHGNRLSLTLFQSDSGLMIELKTSWLSFQRFGFEHVQNAFTRVRELPELPEPGTEPLVRFRSTPEPEP
jgi:hypothetical protein